MCQHDHESESAVTSRRKFIQQSSLIGAGLLLASPLQILAMNDQTEDLSGKVKSRGLAARDKSGILSPWEFERRQLRDDDVLLDIKYVGVCHSDIHQLRGEWGEERYPQVPGHEIAGIVAAVGKNVTKFKVGDRAGVGCMVDSCGTCASCKSGLEQHCDNWQAKFTYGYPDPTSPTGITQGGYANNIVCKEHFVIKIPDHIRLQDAAPLLCAGITTYSPIVTADIKAGDKVGVAGIGGLGHMAIKLAVARGAEVYAFTTSESKRDDILKFGAKQAIVISDDRQLYPHFKSLDYMISTIPVDYDVALYASCVKPHGHFTQVGMPKEGKLTINHFYFVRNRVNFNGAMIGGIPQTQEIMDYCADNQIVPQIQMIDAGQINDVWNKVVNKEARYRYVIDAATI